MRMKYILLISFWVLSLGVGHGQEHSIAHEWSENLLEAIRNDFARPTVHARNLYHSSVAMYDIWSLYDTSGVSDQVLAGKTLHGFNCPVSDFPKGEDLQAQREEAISYAMYRIIRSRFAASPGVGTIYDMIDGFMAAHGYDPSIQTVDYATGDPAAVGNYIASCILDYGYGDNSNEQNGYVNQFYQATNPPLVIQFEGNADILDYNRWQPLTLDVFIDQSGNEIPLNTPEFLGPEWGTVFPFALAEEDLTVYNKDGNEYWVYHDPGPPPLLDPINGEGTSSEYEWGFSLVSKWSAHLDRNDPTVIDISPASIGNIPSYPQNILELRDFYDAADGGDISQGRSVNPKTGMPYEEQLVLRGDYGRILAEFWADGPDSETPPGHWVAILNEIKDHPQYDKRYNGTGEVLEELEYDVKAYLTLSGAMHDAAITAWGAKGYYDYVRPVSAIRALADLGQSTSDALPNYHVAGIKLDDGLIEMVEAGDPLAGANNEHLNKIKLYAWRGPDFITDPSTSEAGCGWILAENWWPYQRPSFVTPPFAGYVSGHSTYSRAAAEVLTLLTGDEYFPGGMGVFEAPANEFLVFENGPSQDIQLQWATYRDASDQCSLSRIWGGIHPPADDIPGRLMGIEIGVDAFHFAKEYFYNDADGDGFYSYQDCDDTDPMINPDVPETCDNQDNNCNAMIDEGLTLQNYYLDADGDGFGDAASVVESCSTTPPTGYVADATDCNDGEALANPGFAEVCDGVDNDCNGIIDDGIQLFTYFLDNDGDGFGTNGVSIDTCQSFPLDGFVTNASDCDDNDPNINPDRPEVCDGVDNDCTGRADDGLEKNRYYLDADGDGYGDPLILADTCITSPPAGYVTNALDCDDANARLNPLAVEICDGIDNDCNGIIDDGLQLNRYFMDRDADGYGDAGFSIDTCIDVPPLNFVIDSMDCDDGNPSIYPGATEISDNGVDEDCTGSDYFRITKVYPNPIADVVRIHFEVEGNVKLVITDLAGKSVLDQDALFVNNATEVDLSGLAGGVYVLRLEREGNLATRKVVKQ